MFSQMLSIENIYWKAGFCRLATTRNATTYLLFKLKVENPT